MFMCRIASLFFLQRVKGNMSGDRAISTTSGRGSSSFFLCCKARRRRKFTPLGEHAPSHATVENWVAQLKRGDFSTYDAPRPGRPKTATTPEIIDQIHELINSSASEHLT
jgi:hypothetical protein